MTAAADAARCDALLLELFGQDQFTIKLGLDAMAEAARIEGLGRCARITVHIAGTNGKGTTSAALQVITASQCVVAVRSAPIPKSTRWPRR